MSESDSYRKGNDVRVGRCGRRGAPGVAHGGGAIGVGGKVLKPGEYPLLSSGVTGVYCGVGGKVLRLAGEYPLLSFGVDACGGVMRGKKLPGNGGGGIEN